MTDDPQLVQRQVNRTFACIASGVLAALGGVVIAGWILHVEVLKQIIPGALPMKPNMAAGFLLCGITLAIVSRNRTSKPMTICAMAISAGVGVLSAMTLGEYIFGWNFPIEEWLITGPVPGVVDALHPGRVLFVTALGFLLCASALFAASTPVSKSFRFRIVVALGASLLFIGVIPVVGFLFEITLGPRWNFMGMAISSVPPSIGFTLLGCGLLSLLQSEGRLTWSLNRLTTAGFAIGLALMVTAAAAAFSFTKRMSEATTSTAHREELLTEVQEIMTSATKLASQERLYVIVGDEALLKERQRIEGDIEEDFLAIRKLTSTDPIQQRRLDAMEALIGKRIEWEEQVITVRREQGVGIASKMVAGGHGIKLTDEISALLIAMEDDERRFLDDDRKQARIASSMAFSLLPSGIFLSLIILSLGVFSLNAGVSEQKQTEGELRQSEEGMRAILESALDCVITMDHQGRVVEFNPAAERTFGYRRDEAIGQLLSELIIPPSLRERHQKGLSRYLATGEAPVLGKRLELSAVRRDGSEFPVELAITRIGSQTPPMFTGFIRDITERKQAENALRQAEEKYRSIFENAIEGIFQNTPEGRFLSVNPALARTLGFDSPEELINSREDIERQGYVDPALREKFKKTLDENGVIIGFEYEVYRKDGTKIWVSENCRAARDTDGTVLYYEGTVEDISKRKQAEDALRVSEMHLQTVVENLDEGVIVSDLKGGLLHWNRAALEVHGYTDLEEGLRSLTDFVDTFKLSALDGTQIPVGEWPLSRVLRGENLHDLELRVRNIKADWERIFNYGGTLVHDANNQPLMAIVTVSDITGRKQAEERLLEQADIINRAQDAIIIRNFENENVTFWNKGAETLYGWSVKEALGKSIGELIFSDAKDREAPLKQLISTGEFHGELKQVAKDGRAISVDCRATLIRNADGEPRSVLLINTDVTEHKKLETQLLRAQRLESIGTLASGVAHDLNNILTPILMCAQTLRDDLADEDRQSAISLIEKSAQRGASVVKQVLTFARGIEGERVLLKPNHLIEEMIDIARKTFPKSIEIRSRYLEDLWSIEGDPTQLHQVLLNLCVNARDAMPNGGLLTLVAENFAVDEHYAAMMPDLKAGPYVILSVTDSGSGMPRATIDKIFDPFFTTKDVGKGTGLGLSTALGILKSHGGFISVYSEIGRGTTFKIFLPARTSDEELAKSETVTAPIQGHGQYILVVDDEPNILQITKMIFEKHNYRVVLANDGPEALALFAQQMGSIGGVLTDVAMPYMDGVALVRAIRKMKSDMPIIASTGHGDPGGLAELESLGVKDFLTKPYNTEKLLAAVHSALAGAG